MEKQYFQRAVGVVVLLIVIVVIVPLFFYRGHSSQTVVVPKEPAVPVVTAQPVVVTAPALAEPAKEAVKPAAKTTIAPATKSVVISLCAFTDVNHAKQVVHQLRAKHFQAFSVKRKHQILIYVGPFLDKTKAEALLAPLEKITHCRGKVFGFNASTM